MSIDRSPEQKLREVQELVDLAEEQMRAQLRREYPSLGTDVIEERIGRWLLRRPSVGGDGDLEVVAWPRV